MSKLPTGWAEATLDDVTSPRGHKADPQSLGDMPFLGMDHIEAHTSKLLGSQPVRELKSAVAVFKKGDLLYGRLRSYLNKVHLAEFDGAASAEFIVFPPSEAIEQRFLQSLLRSPDYRVLADQRSTGDRPRVKFDNVSDFEFSLPPLAEQRRIVRKLDTLSACTTTARTHLTAIANLVEKYKAEVLTLGIQGQLTSDWRAKNDASLGHPERLEKHVLGVRYGSSAKSSKTGEIPVLRMGNIQSMELDWTDLVYTDRPDEIEKYQLEPGDVLFNRTNSPALVGKTAIYRGEQPAIYAGYLIRVKCGETLLPEYLNYALNSSVGRAYCWRVKSDSVSQSNINAQKLKAFEFLVPTIEEQQQIIDQIHSAFSKIDRLAAEAEKAQKLSDRLDERILAKAFAGQLVSQDPSDEPASVLLERIRETRANAPKKTRPRRTKATSMKKDPKDLLLADSAKWPANGVTSKELAKRVVMPHADLRDALFELLGGTKPQLEQVFDKTEERMRLKRVAQ